MNPQAALTHLYALAGAQANTPEQLAEEGAV